MNSKKLHTATFMNPDTNQNVKQKLYDFLKDFDPMELKYSVEPERVFSDKHNRLIPFELRDILIRYDGIYGMETLNKETYSAISENLRLVYGSSDVVENDIKIFNLTEKKMLGQFLAIPLLEKMFDEDYFNFEWDMHVSQNFREHRNDYQRDHFIHQIRDMYSMLILLGEHGFYEASLKILSDRSISKISWYTQQKLTEFFHNRRGVYSTLETLYPNLKEYIDNNESISQSTKQKYASMESYAENYFMKYVIYASSILSALFHDMGYPICHFLSVRNRTSAYNPTMYMYTRNEVESFDHIASLLSSSLLFTIMSREEIKSSMQVKDSGKYNHGAYSAIAFLMQFYNSGIIFSLPEEKQCAIELAAVAIYNHTLEYKISRKNTKKFFYQPLFKQNPISFILRLCDDLQEWGRRYFEVSTESDIPICSFCLTPSIFNHQKDKTVYRCLCSKNTTYNNPNACNSFRFKNFYNRKLYLVSTSDYMTSYLINVEGGKKALCFHINYDYYRLLNVTRINHTYAKFRLSELNDLKKLLKNQDFISTLGFDYIYLDYFMTSNPITIKTKILEKFICCIHDEICVDKDDISNVNLDQIVTHINNYVDTISEDKQMKIEMESELYNLLDDKVFEFYKNVLIEVIELRDNFRHCKVDLEKVKNSAESFINKMIMKEKNTSDYYKQIMTNLLLDTFEQYSKETIIYQSNGEDMVETFIDTEKYYNQYSPNKYSGEAFYNSVRAYCNSENEFNCYNCIDGVGDPIKYINYFSDLYLFEMMNRIIQEHDLEIFKSPQNDELSQAQ